MVLQTKHFLYQNTKQILKNITEYVKAEENGSWVAAHHSEEKYL
jgi:hypothetical protein